jgi:hypothetical protein
VQKAFHEWYIRKTEQHDRTVARMLEELHQRSRTNAG